MLGNRDSFCLARSVVAACLAVLFSLAWLAPLAARSLSASNSSCCRNRAKCCCRKANAKRPVGPGLSGKSCGNDCDGLTLGCTGTNGFVQPSYRSLAPAIEFVISVGPGESSPEAHLSDHSLLQRPPPASPLA